MKKTLFVAGSAAIIIIVLVIFRVVLKNRNTREQALKTARVEKCDISVKVTESGRVEPVTTVNVKSELAGEVKKLFVSEGDSVKTGDRLALVQEESSQARQVAQARASLERAKLDLEDAKRDFEREKELYRKGFVAKKDVEDAEKSYRSGKIQHELAEKQLWLVLGGAEPARVQSLAAKTFDNIIVRSPISGIIINLYVEEGEMITSGTQAFGGGGTTIMRVADLSKMIVKTEINEVDITRVKVGQPVDIGFDAIKGRVYHGRVKKIAPAGSEKQNIVVYPVEVEILSSVLQKKREWRAESSPRHLRDRIFEELTEQQRNAMRKEIQSLRASEASREEIQDATRERLKEYGVTLPEGDPQFPVSRGQPTEDRRVGMESIKPGMTADLDIITGKAEDVLCVPKQAVTEEDGRTVVMLIENGKPVPQPVVTGLENDVRIEIKEGLEEGDEVLATQFGRRHSGDSERFKGRGHPM